MNKLLVFIFFLMFMSFSYCSFGTIRIIQHQVGPRGCNSSTENHGNGLSIITCTDPGFQKCEFTYLPNGKKDLKLVKQVIKSVEKEIKKENFKGEMNRDGRLIEFEGTDVFNYSITIHELNEDDDA